MVKRALAALTVAAFLTLVIDVVGSHHSAVSLVPGAVFVLLATAGYAWAAERAARWPAYVHIALLLLVAYVVFVSSEGSVGATLMLVVVVSESVLLLPLPAVVVVVVLVPFVHTGMSMSDGLREGLGLLGAAAFAAVVTTLLRARAARRAPSWPRRTRGCASTPCRPSSWPRRRSATGWRGTSTTASGTR